jgi:hypothetical protein
MLSNFSILIVYNIIMDRSVWRGKVQRTYLRELSKPNEHGSIHDTPTGVTEVHEKAAQRSGIPIEIVSKVIMRHAHLSTTQRYLGKVTDVEAMRWIENLYGWKRTGAAHQHTAPAIMILVVSVRKGEKNQKRISSGSSPIYP